ncbi:contact-dependent growth inhibition system immunity protein [Erwinia pyrifoliae]|uniref:contact-dependent growth inhibition system immunity protein n=1 Tax=Erwinia pyrifoliae TaxID=79967 RepID=UPI0001960F45|nr:contact-dependent growth inhibition system immunity protein [Erwinia pyrifoliae]AUX72470.1 hypothetical protein CPI84_08250 [Erwinia pyrifoliae]MCA8877279.1 hypothetical protein [Erwinia pyrifoliae]MCT2388775.1 contact-dependent growth inhibition system immunity protein [Erwinia pyrifoliae]MCU8586945.1 contact-dependent growth inhibition system immunity protein [Erwinia pyrifoliae]CAX55844.1 conserved uncharcterized protein [Erwinia pyrifoliae Ep1/96]
MENNYPLIANLMDAWLNQDYDYICESETIEGAVDYYIRNSSPKILEELLLEFETFITIHSDAANETFEETFHPEVIINDVEEFFTLFKEKVIASGKI